MTEVFYKITVMGASSAQKALDDTNKKAHQWGKNFAADAGEVDTAFKSIARDIDAVAGKTGATFGRWASDIAGIAGTLGTGGLGAALAILTGAVGLVASAWKDWDDTTKAQKKAADDALRAEKTWLEDTLTRVNKVTSALKEKTVEENRQVVIAHDIHLAELATQKTVLLAELAAVRGNADDTIAVRKKLADNTRQIRETGLSRDMAMGEIEVGIRARIAEDTNRIELDEIKDLEESEKKKTEIKKREIDARNKFYDQQQADMTAWLIEQNRLEADEDRQDAAREQDNNESLARDKKRLTAMDKAEDDNFKKGLLRYNQERDAVVDARNDQIKATKEYARAVAEVAAGDVYAMSVNTAFSVSMFAVGEAVGFAMKQLEKFGSINRENYRDMLAITENTKAAFAAEAQAFLFQLGLKAGGQAIFETAAAGQENALAMGSAAILDFRGAGMHLASAGMHSAAAGAYSVLAVGGVGASLAIGSQRGEGGMVGLTQEEKDKKNRDDQANMSQEDIWRNQAAQSRYRKEVLGIDDGSGGAGGAGRRGPSGGSYRGGGERSAGGEGTTVVNIYNEPGSMSAADEDRAARTTARHVKRAQRDWFAQRAMSG
jgi:uncharacterized membrane protein YgcG